MNRVLVLMATSLVLAGCGSESVNAPRGELIATYVLRSIDGTTLPAAGNGESMQPFTVLADTIRLYSSGEGVEILVSQREGQAPQRQTQSFTVTAPSVNRLDIDYGCNDTPGALASCIAPPHHRLVTTATGLTIDESALYRTPLVFERIGGSP